MISMKNTFTLKALQFDTGVFTQTYVLEIKFVSKYIILILMTFSNSVR